VCEEEMAPNKETYRSDFVSCLHPELIRGAKGVDRVVTSALERAMKRFRRPWKTIEAYVKLRTELLRWRAERWVREILRSSTVKWKDWWEVTGVTYVMFNTINTGVWQPGDGTAGSFYQ